MESKLNLHGLPLCLSGITRPSLSLSSEMADHDRRREVMKRRKPAISAAEHADRGIGIQRMEERLVRAIRDGEIDEDLAALVHHLYQTHLACSAKAA